MTKAILTALLFLFSLQTHAAIRVAVTVDDLPEHGEAPKGVTRVEIARKMLTELKNHSVPEVYGFINAEQLADERPLREILQLWVEAGYSLGNHSYSHKSLTKTSVADYKREIERNEKSLQFYAGAFAWRYFRYPYLHERNTLEKRNAIRAYLKERNYKIAQV